MVARSWFRAQTSVTLELGLRVLPFQNLPSDTLDVMNGSTESKDSLREISTRLRPTRRETKIDPRVLLT